MYDVMSIQTNSIFLSQSSVLVVYLVIILILDELNPMNSFSGVGRESKLLDLLSRLVYGRLDRHDGRSGQNAPDEGHRRSGLAPPSARPHQQ